MKSDGSPLCSPLISAILCSETGAILPTSDDCSSSELMEEPDDTELPAESDGDGATGDTAVAPFFPTRPFGGVLISDVARRLLSSMEITTLYSSHRVLRRVMVAMVKGDGIGWGMMQERWTSCARNNGSG